MKEKIKDLQRANEDLQGENTKLSINIDEMRGIFRGKLLHFMNEKIGDEKLQYNLNAKEELIRTYTEKEEDLTERYSKARDYSQLRLTVDNIEDFEFIKWIYDHLYPNNNNFKLNDIVNFLIKNPSNKNKHLIGSEGYEQFW